MEEREKKRKRNRKREEREEEQRRERQRREKRRERGTSYPQFRNGFGATPLRRDKMSLSKQVLSITSKVPG